ncbi:MAG TPA: ribosome silencing factor [Nitrosospira sp.]|nr:ribosome silencing factor [Nitrosospira sp.]
MTLAKLVKTIVAALEEIKARDIEILDVSKMTTLCDRMIIASGDSNRQTKAIANNVAEKVKAGGGTVYGIEGEQAGEWVLVDLGDVLVHIMQSAVRSHYNLEELWAQARKVSTAALGRRKIEPSAEQKDHPEQIEDASPEASLPAPRRRKVAKPGPDDSE